MIKILIVEDDENAAKTIDAALNFAGYTGEICSDGALAAERILTGGYDLVLLDVMLPGMDGFQIMESLGDVQTPVIFLTAMQNVYDKVKGLRLGAEDYIVKPFEALELIARIEVVLRRRKKISESLTHGDITVNTEKRTVEKAGEPVALTPKEFDVLTFFMRHKDVAVTRATLLSTVWGYGFEGETRTVDMHIQQIRKKLDLYDDLITLPKFGYRLESR